MAELWHFRDLLYFLAWRDVKIRYKQTVLGAAWAILQPATMMVVMTILFAHMAEMIAVCGVMACSNSWRSRFPLASTPTMVTRQPRFERTSQ